MKVGVLFAYMDFLRQGRHHRGVLQPQIGPLIAALLPDEADVHLVNDTWDEPDWSRDYDLLFISSLHSDFDRARQISHYWRRRGAATVYGGILASTYPELCQPYFDAVVVGDPESTVGRIYRDACDGALQPIYVGEPFDPEAVPTPRFDLLADRQVVPLALEATRGCPFSCEFCALTGYGTRYHYRPAELVVRDIRRGQEMLRGLVPDDKLRHVVFCDNNIGGNPKKLRQLCDALRPLDLIWGSAITFNAVSDAGLVRELSSAGCRFLFMGLESFNPEAIQDMHKYQNAIGETRRVMDQCRDLGIVVVSGLMISPITDTCEYLESIPRRLRESGLHVPGFICFESPFPGTPFFHRLAAADPPALLPGALLRDFSGYTMVVRPQRDDLDRLLATYRDVLAEVYSWSSRWGKWLHDSAHFLSHGFVLPSLVDAVHMRSLAHRPHPDRTYLAGTDVPPPEASSVPFTDDDFDGEEERRRVLDPMPVTGPDGRVLPAWLASQKVFLPTGNLSADALARAS